ncbi:MAG TPA: ribonuclease HII [Chthoniobacterales bacterium]|nr:ribonuclease HII [Chthoniobacterales bacterium]
MTACSIRQGSLSCRPTLQSEVLLFSQGIRPVAGVDEAGRGPLAGPVVAAAVILPENLGGELLKALERLDDSKKLRPRVREELFVIITNHPEISWALGEGSVEEIGDLNILRATHLAMRRAVEALQIKPAHALIDGLPVRGFPLPQTALVGGDGLSLSIAAASVVAKVTRDRMMEQLHEEFPQYGFAKHSGYATAEHKAMLCKHGPCKHHRRGFAPVDQASFDFQRREGSWSLG